MTRNELRNQIYFIVRDWRNVDKIFDLFARLSPEEGHSNLFEKKKAMVPHYDESRVVRPKEKPKFTPEQRSAAREVLRELGLI